MYFTFNHSHTKNNIISYIIELNINIKYNYINKDKILLLLDEYLCDMDLNFTFNCNQYNIRNIRDFIKFLELPRPADKNNIISLQDHKKYIQIGRKINCFVKNGNMIERTPFDDEGQLMAEAKLLGVCASHIPSCRRALRELNNSLGPKDKIDVVLSPELQNSLDTNTLLRKHSKPTFSVKRQSFYITFD
jgi:hypothetical protein